MTGISDDADRRLIELEQGLLHFRELQEERYQNLWQAINQIKTRNDKQDARFARKIEQIHRLLWKAIGWGAIFLTSTLATIILKTLQLL